MPCAIVPPNGVAAANAAIDVDRVVVARRVGVRVDLRLRDRRAPPVARRRSCAAARRHDRRARAHARRRSAGAISNSITLITNPWRSDRCAMRPVSVSASPARSGALVLDLLPRVQRALGQRDLLLQRRQPERDGRERRHASP